MDTW